MILRSLLQCYLDVHRFLVMFIDCVAYYLRITKTLFLIFGDEIFLVLFVQIFHKFFRTEDRFNLALLIGFLHRPFKLTIRKCFISFNLYTVDLQLLFLVYCDLQEDLISLGSVGTLENSHLGIAKTFAIKKALDHGLGPVNLRWCDLIPFHETNLLLNILLLTLLHPEVVNICYPRPVGKSYLKPYTVTRHFCLQYFHIGKKSLTPESFQCGCDIITGNLYLLSFLQLGKTNKHKLLVFVHRALHSRHINIGDIILLGRGGIVHTQINRSRRGYGVVGLCQGNCL